MCGSSFFHCEIVHNLLMKSGTFCSGWVKKLSEAYYLFCFAKGDPAPDGEPGFGLIEGQKLLRIPFRELVMVVSKVPLEDFAGPGAEERLNKVEWVTPRALRHGQVVQEMNALTPVLPARFGTLFSSEQKLISLAESNYDSIIEFLELIRDKDEWAIRGYLDLDRLKTTLFQKRIKTLDIDLSSLSPGVRYFREKQIQAEVEKEIASWVNEQTRKIESSLVTISSHLQARKAHKNAFDENNKELVANWAVLLNKTDYEKLGELVLAINSSPDYDGLELTISGPWPPYSFAPALEMENW